MELIVCIMVEVLHASVFICLGTFGAKRKVLVLDDESAGLHP